MPYKQAQEISGPLHPQLKVWRDYVGRGLLMNDSKASLFIAGQMGLVAQPAAYQFKICNYSHLIVPHVNSPQKIAEFVFIYLQLVGRSDDAGRCALILSHIKASESTDDSLIEIRIGVLCNFQKRNLERRSAVPDLMWNFIFQDPDHNSFLGLDAVDFADQIVENHQSVALHYHHYFKRADWYQFDGTMISTRGVFSSGEGRVVEYVYEDSNFFIGDQFHAPKIFHPRYVVLEAGPTLHPDSHPQLSIYRARPIQPHDLKII